MERYLPFWEMEPADELLAGESVYSGKTSKHDGQVFAKEGQCYAIYLPTAKKSGVLDLRDAAGRFVKRWYSPRTGKFVGVRESIEGGSKVKMGPAPNESNQDWVVLVSKRKR